MKKLLCIIILFFCFCSCYAQAQASEKKEFTTLSDSNNLELIFSNGLTIKCFSYVLNRDKKVTVYFKLSDGRLAARNYDAKIIVVRTVK